MQAEIEARVKTYTASNDEIYTLKAVNGEGLWSIHRLKGQVPEALKGKFTRLTRAMQAIEDHIKLIPTKTSAKKASKKDAKTSSDTDR